ncbi:MAG: glycosyltransferase family 2 protein [Anaerolineae bacterium]|nr:glycosyltransferase family 2 protein [Anaerolineae bacterium]
MTNEPSPPPGGVLVIIPAYNEADNIAQVIAQVRDHAPDADICVINDGSLDGTGKAAAAAGAITLNMPFNVGIGAAVQTGFLYAYRRNYTVAVRIDGDGQHPPANIPVLIQALQASGADMVIGSRFLAATPEGYQGTLPRRIGIRLLAGVIALITGERLTDPTSGLMAANPDAIAFCAHEYPHDYPEPEARVMMHRAGLRVREIPVAMQARMGGVSSITTARSVYYMSKVLLALLLDVLRMPRWRKGQRPAPDSTHSHEDLPR